jgi:hypothetical protein
VLFRVASLWFLGVVAAAVGCFDVDVGDAAITCDDDDDCPSPLFCDGALCQRGGAANAPGVIADSIVIDGSPARPGGTVTVSFSATRTLGAAPDFVVDDVSFVLDSGTSGADVTATGSVAANATDGDHDLDVVLVDDAGNTSQALALGTIVVDGTGPEVASVDAPQTVPNQGALVVEVSASEVLSAIRCVYAVTLSDFSLDVVGTVAGTRGTCSGVVEGAAFASAVVVDAVLVDVAGNSARHDTVASVALTP